MSIVGRFDFPAGRYHATPWGRHVNEGAIEWPPSPWRLLRALISVGYNRLGWQGAPPREAVGLLEALAATPPRFLLPPASAAHTRHYMPSFKGKTTRVLDTFAVLDRVDAPLYVAWDVELAPEPRALLGELLKALPYLGRAESWVTACLVDDAPTGDWARHGPRSPGDGWERVDLLGCISAPQFLAWREESVPLALVRELEAAREAAVGKGKAPPAQMTKKGRETVEVRFPPSLVEALRVDTHTLQEAGWSLPPGSRWLTYWRPADALERAPVAVTRPAVDEPVDAVLYAVMSETKGGSTLPPLKHALLRAETIHEALVSIASKEGAGPVQFAGRTADGPAAGHRHPSVLPVSLDGCRRPAKAPGRASIDHVLVTVPSGCAFDAVSLRALRATRRTWARGVSSLWLTPIWEGRAAERGDLPWLTRATTWESHTPFIAPRHLKQAGRNTLGGQIRSELEGRGIGSLQSVEVSAEVEGRVEWLPVGDFWQLWKAPSPGRRLDTRWREFRRERRTPRPHIASQPALCLRLVLAAPAVGPIALGYGSHLGLGLFAARPGQPR